MNKKDAFELEEILKGLVKSRSPKTQYQAARALELLTPVVENHRKAVNNWTWDGHDPLVLARQARRILYKAPYYLNEAKAQLNLLDEETQDYLHALEFLELPEEKEIEIKNRLKENRRVRRTHKRFVELMEPFGKYAYENKPFVTGLKFVIDEMSKTAEVMTKREYHPRVATDLVQAFKEIAPTKEVR
jgi:hypothetical protein